jgi:hypothetical protein
MQMVKGDGDNEVVLFLMVTFIPKDWIPAFAGMTLGN